MLTYRLGYTENASRHRDLSPRQFFLTTCVCWELIPCMYCFHRLLHPNLGDTVSGTRADSEGIFYSSILFTGVAAFLRYLVD